MKDEHDPNNDSGAPGQKRRGFLKRAIALASLAIVGARAVSGVAARSQPRSFETISRPRDLPSHYPSPSMIPGGYTLFQIYSDRPDGFQGGSSEVALWYRSPYIERGYLFPLAIFLAPSPRTPFGGIKDGPAEIIEISSNGTPVAGQYYDGAWFKAPGGHLWRHDRTVALVMNAFGMEIGIRGFIRGGITRNELITVANALTV